MTVRQTRKDYGKYAALMGFGTAMTAAGQVIDKNFQYKMQMARQKALEELEKKKLALTERQISAAEEQAKSAREFQQAQRKDTLAAQYREESRAMADKVFGRELTPIEQYLARAIPGLMKGDAVNNPMTYEEAIEHLGLADRFTQKEIDSVEPAKIKRLMTGLETLWGQTLGRAGEEWNPEIGLSMLPDLFGYNDGLMIDPIAGAAGAAGATGADALGEVEVTGTRKPSVPWLERMEARGGLFSRENLRRSWDEFTDMPEGLMDYFTYDIPNQFDRYNRALFGSDTSPEGKAAAAEASREAAAGARTSGSGQPFHPRFAPKGPTAADRFMEWLNGGPLMTDEEGNFTPYGQ